MQLKITPRFITAMATAAVAPLLVYGLVSIFTLREVTSQSVREGNQNVARRAAEQIEQYIRLNIRVLEALATDIQNTLLQPVHRDRALTDHALDFPEFRELTLFSADGSVLATSLIGKATVQAPTDDNGDQPRVAPITIDDDLLPTTTITIPLSRLGQRDGWLIGELSLEELWRIVDSIRVGTAGFALLVAEDGRLIAHGNPNAKARIAGGDNLATHDLIRATRSTPVSPGVVDGSPDETGPAGSIRGTPSYRVYNDNDGQEQLGVSSPIVGLGWTLVVEQPTSEAFALAYQLGIGLFGWILGVLILTLLIGYYWGRSFLRPIFSLIRGTEALAAGRLDERVVIGGHDELAQLGAAFNGMASRLVELQEDARKQARQAMFGTIAAGLVHDISHPIQNINNSCKLILKLDDDVEYRATFQRTVEREFSSIKRLLDDLRNLSRPTPLERFPVDLNRAVREAVELMQPLAETAGLSLHKKLAERPLYIEGNLFALERVYRNLIVNAIEATSPGGQITVSTQHDSGHARVKIADTGLGIAPDRIGAIFEDFSTTKRGGLGLGLAVSRKIVEQLGGSIHVTSRVGSGTTFVVEFEETETRPLQLTGQY